VFGEVRAQIDIESRADIERYAGTFASSGDAPLSELTRGIHSHTVRAPSLDALQAAKRELRERGILLDG
jgi:transcriptional regulator of NAD metabolism